MKSIVLSVALLLVIMVASTMADPPLMSGLTSPLVFEGGTVNAYRDPLLFYHNGVFHLYCTLSKIESIEGTNMLVNVTAHSQSKNLKD